MSKSTPSPLITKETLPAHSQQAPSPLTGEGWGEGEYPSPIGIHLALTQVFQIHTIIIGIPTPHRSPLRGHQWDSVSHPGSFDFRHDVNLSFTLSLSKGRPFGNRGSTTQFTGIASGPVSTNRPRLGARASRPHQLNDNPLTLRGLPHTWQGNLVGAVREPPLPN